MTRKSTQPARRTLGYFRDRKFAGTGHDDLIASRLREYGFGDGGYKKIIVTWDWTEDAKREAGDAKIELWDFRKVVREISQATGGPPY